MSRFRNAGTYIRTACGQSVKDEIAIALALVLVTILAIFGFDSILGIVAVIAKVIGYIALALAPALLVVSTILSQRRKAPGFKKEVAFIAERRDAVETAQSEFDKADATATAAENQATFMARHAQEQRTAHLKGRAARLPLSELDALQLKRTSAEANAADAVESAENLRVAAYEAELALEEAKAKLKNARNDFRAQQDEAETDEDVKAAPIIGEAFLSGMAEEHAANDTLVRRTSRSQDS